jgi:hypothetical protein
MPSLQRRLLVAGPSLEGGPDEIKEVIITL